MIGWMLDTGRIVVSVFIWASEETTFEKKEDKGPTSLILSDMRLADY